MRHDRTTGQRVSKTKTAATISHLSSSSSFGPRENDNDRNARERAYDVIDTTISSFSRSSFELRIVSLIRTKEKLKTSKERYLRTHARAPVLREKIGNNLAKDERASFSEEVGRSFAWLCLSANENVTCFLFSSIRYRATTTKRSRNKRKLASGDRNIER